MPVTHGVAGSSPVRTAEMPVSRSINRHFSFYCVVFSIYSFGRLWMMIVYLPDMCFKKDGNKKEFRIFTRNSLLLRSGRDSNPRPHAWQACILTSWTTRPKCFQKRRFGRDSNPRPHAWQACILTSWTTEPFLHRTTAVVLNCGAKIDSFSYYAIFLDRKNGKNCVFLTKKNILERPKTKGYRWFMLRMNGLLIKVIKCRLKFQLTVLEFKFFLIFVPHNSCQI